MMFRQTLFAMAAAAAGLLASGNAAAQGYPARPITLVVPSLFQTRYEPGEA